MDDPNHHFSNGPSLPWAKFENVGDSGKRSVQEANS